MSGKMRWGRQATRMRQARAPQGMGVAPTDADSVSRADAAQACYWASMRRRHTTPATISIREAAEQSTRQRKVTITLPKLKFLEGKIT